MNQDSPYTVETLERARALLDEKTLEATVTAMRLLLTPLVDELLKTARGQKSG